MSATPQLPPVAKLEQKTVVDLVSKGKRIDDRGPESYRPLEIKVGVIEKANGSAQVHLGKSKVLVGVKVETGEPFPDTLKKGSLRSTLSWYHWPPPPSRWAPPAKKQ